MSLNHHFYHFQKLTVHDFCGFEMFSCNILRIAWHPLNSIQGIFLEMRKVKSSYPNKHMKDLKFTINSIIEAVQFLLSMKFHMSWRNIFAKTHSRTILVFKGYLEQGKIIHLHEILDLTIMLSKIRKYFDQ